MNRYRFNILTTYFIKNNFRHISTYNHSKNDLDLIKNFTPKQIGKIAIHVSKYSNSDIRIWDNFKESTINSINLFDYKDLLRIVEGLNNFYLYLDYELRSKDLIFFNRIIDKLFEFCDSYNCSQLSQIAQTISNFSNSHTDFCKLFSKVSLLFKLRLAEATHNDIVKLLASFSRVGIYDKSLTDTLIQLVLKNNYTPDELKSITISCTLLGHKDSDLLNKMCDIYYKNNNGLTLNDLGILSFIFSKSSFTNDKVVSIFERNLNRIDNLNIVELHGTDLPSFCLNLHNIGVKVPEKLINLIDFKSLQPNLLMDMLDLLSLYPTKQEIILVKCKEIKRNTEDNLKLLNYISRGPFNENSRQLFKLLMSDVNELGESDLSVLMADAHLLKLPVTWLLDEQLYDLKPSGSIEFTKILLRIQASIVSFIRFFTNDSVTGYSNHHCLVNNHSMSPLINKIEAKLSGVTDQNSLLNILLDVIPLENDVPRILVRELERLLCKEIKETVIHERLKVILVEGTRSVLFPIYPNDLIQLEAKRGDTSRHKTGETSGSIETHSQPNPPEMPSIGPGVGPSFYGIPPYNIPMTPTLIKMYIICKLNYNLIPVCYYGWSKLANDDEKAKYLVKITTHHHI